MSFCDNNILWIILVILALMLIFDNCSFSCGGNSGCGCGGNAGCGCNGYGRGGDNSCGCGCGC